MIELAEKYFNGDLTEAEDEVLNESLASSDEVTSRFMELAEKAYYGFGLPEPKWPDTLPPGASAPPQHFGGPWLGPLVVVTGIAVLAALGYHCCRVHSRLSALMPEKPVSSLSHNHSRLSVGVSMPRKPVQVPAAAGKVANTSTGIISAQTRFSAGAAVPNAAKPCGTTGSNTGVAPGANPVVAYAGGIGVDKIPVKTDAEKPDTGLEETVKPGVADKSSPSAALPALGNQAALSQPAAEKPSVQAPVVTPMAWNEGASKTYSNLSVVVDQPVLGFVTVQVLDPNGGQAALLYRGNLDPGKWVFEWNGKMPGVRPAPAGYYFIQLQSGSQVLRKKIQIH
jgi:hypothetical protein